MKKKKNIYIYIYINNNNRKVKRKWNDNLFSACIIIMRLKDTVLWKAETESETLLLRSNHYGRVCVCT